MTENHGVASSILALATNPHQRLRKCRPSEPDPRPLDGVASKLLLIVLPGLGLRRS